MMVNMYIRAKQWVSSLEEKVSLLPCQELSPREAAFTG